ncbi:MAG: cytochrome c [Sphingomonadales bacterium]|nr:cytochrome c [Sphingomonadales bacterium]
MKPLALLAAALLLTLAACGGPQTPGAKAAHERHEHFEALGKAFKRLGEELKQDAPDIAKIKTNAAAINRAAGQVKTWFPAGSGPQDGVKTHARETVWSQPDEFGRAAAKLADAAAALSAAAQSGDLAAVRGAVPPLGAACKGCHDRFRHKED